MKKNKLYALITIFVFLCVCMSACTKNGNTEDSKDSIVQKISKTNPQKVVSLAPSVTEMVCAVGAENMLVGRTDYCDYPESVSSIPSIGTYSSPNVELIVEKSPDLVIASDNISDDVKTQLENAGINVYVSSSSNIEDIKTEIISIGTMLHKEKEAEAVVEDMDAKSAEVEAWKKSLTVKKTVFCDLGSFYTCSDGAFLSDVMEDIGLENIALGAGRQWVQLSAELIAQGNPDVYISFYTSADELKNNETLKSLNCMQNDGLIVLNSELTSMLQRQGPRIVDGELELMGIIYGEK